MTRVTSPVDLMEAQVQTLFRLDGAGRLLTVNEPPFDPAPRLFLGRTTAGNVWRFRHDLPDVLVRDLERILASEWVTDDPRRPSATLDRLREALAGDAPVTEISHGPAWVFPDRIEPPNAVATRAITDPAMLCPAFPWLAAELPVKLPVIAVMDGDEVAAVCHSARTSRHAAEAGVYTVERYRGRGYAAAVVAGWARAVRARGRLPLYSTSWDNVASQGVARRLGLALYGDDLHIA